MADNVNQILGIEEKGEAQYQSFRSTPQRFSINDTAESTLDIVSKIVLIFGIIGGVVILFTMSTVTIPGEYYSHSVTNPSGIALGITTIVSSVMCWACCQVFINISNSLKNLNASLKKPLPTPPVVKAAPSNETQSENNDSSKFDYSIIASFMSNPDAAEFATKVKEYMKEAIANNYGSRHIYDDLEYYKREYGKKAKEAGFNLDEIIRAVQYQTGK